MNRLTIVLLGSMIALPSIVNSQKNDSSRLNSGSHKIESTNKDFRDLINFLLKNGKDELIKEHLAAVIGLPGPMSAKIQTLNETYTGKNLIEHACTLIYQEVSQPISMNPKRRPYCIYLQKHQILGHDDESLYFRVNLDGRLEKVVMIRGKRDDNGKIVRGASVPTNQDIESAESKREFAAEIALMQKWLDSQRKASHYN